ncbi:MAG: ComF family protein [Lachnospiraceae bacterium]|nr:ComF family protein [Lachnospiraceae bacterium]
MIKDIVLDMLFPRRCPVCDSVLPFGGGLICEDCSKKLRNVREPRCRKCGRMLTGAGKEYCPDCENVRHGFERAVSAFVYNDAMQDAIFRFKYQGRQEYADFFAESMSKYLGRELRGFGAEALIPVPLHKDRLKKRGYNQAVLLSERLGKIMGIRVEKDLVKRVRATAPQKTLTREERRKNLKKAFKLSGNGVKLTKVIIVDDIYTTGSTVDEISDLLRVAGVRSVYVATVCSGTPL